jgi:ElaB/YqjD/DUF883 family membrane-anchored ribosome-binding protein
MKGIDINKVNASDLAGIPAKVAEEVRRTVDSAYDDVSRNVRKARRAAEEAIDDSRREIKRRPFASVGLAAAAGLVTGLAIGWWIGYSSRD